MTHHHLIALNALAIALALLLCSCATTVSTPSSLLGETRVNNDVQNGAWPQVQGLEDQQLEVAINERIRKAAMALFDDFWREAAPEFSPLYDVAYRSSRHGRILSMRLDEIFMSTMLAQPAEKSVSLTIDLIDGYVYRLEDLFQPEKPWREQLNNLIQDNINNLSAASMRMLGPWRGVEREQEFYLTDRSLVIFYQRHVYTGQNGGPLEFHIPLSLIKGLFAPPLGGMFLDKTTW